MDVKSIVSHFKKKKTAALATIKCLIYGCNVHSRAHYKNDNFQITILATADREWSENIAKKDLDGQTFNGTSGHKVIELDM